MRNNYVEQVPSDQLMDGAFSGVTDAIDEFSYYVPPAQMAAYKNFSDVEDNGVGLIVTKRFGYAFVIAAGARLAGGEGRHRARRLHREDRRPADAEDGGVADSQRAARVEAGAAADPARRPDQARRVHASSRRRSIRSRITSQQYRRRRRTSRSRTLRKARRRSSRRALENVRKSGNRKLIVDLRGNAGGDVDEAITAADELLTSGLITSLEGRKVEAKKWQADRAHRVRRRRRSPHRPSTASGAEIFAAAIHGNSRGKVVGVTTYGKSIVQKFIPLPSGGGVYMTVGHYTTPDMKAIKDGGIRPDVIVDLSAQAIRDTSDKDAKQTREDLILNKALKLFGAPALKNAA